MAPPAPLTADACAAMIDGLDRPRLDRLKVYLAALEKWQPAINLVGPATLADPWRRHVLDSAQLWPMLRDAKRVVDLGSGAGFPGMVLAILGGAAVTLIESDQRKATFLREVARLTETDVEILAKRAEAVPPLAADGVTARALAPLDRLLPWVARHLAPGGKAVLLKGADVDRELTMAGKKWTMQINRTASLSDPSATVLTLLDLAQKDVR